MVIENFNEISFPHEKMGGKQMSEALMNNFREALHDLGHKGDFYTWSNRHTVVTFTNEHLNKALANICWSQLYNWVGVENLVARCSDHRPILASFNNQSEELFLKRRLFLCEASWDLENDCNVKETQFWNGERATGDPLDKFQQNLSNF